MLDISYTAMVIDFMACILMLWNLFFFGKYMCKDNYETRSNLVLGCTFQVLANMLAFFGVLTSFIVSTTRVSSVLNPFLFFNMLIWIYYRQICSQWTDMATKTEIKDNTAQRDF
jgi:hypothetical protein